MTSPYLKTKLKALKEALGAKDWDRVERFANEVISVDSSHYNARVFLSLALFNLSRPVESEESYKKAVEVSPGQALARQGLCSFYEKTGRWNECCVGLEEVMEVFAVGGEAIKYAESLQKLIEVRRNHGTRAELLTSLYYLLPSSPSYSLLLTLPPADPTSPTASSIHSLQISLSSPLTTLLEVLSLTEKEETNLVENEIKKRRQRLGGVTLSASETRRAVCSELMKESRLPMLYRAILEDPDASSQEDLRREVEKKLLLHLRTFLSSLSSSFDETSLDLKALPKTATMLTEEEAWKARTRGEVEELAGGMVLIAVGEESAWEVKMEWGDGYCGEKMGEWDWSELGKYAELFPETGLAKLATATSHRLFPPPPSDAPLPPPLSDVQLSLLIESSLATSPNSLVAHLISLRHFSEMKEWDSVREVAEAGLGVVRRIEVEIGRGLDKSRRTLEIQLALALVYLDAPTHHLKAYRLLESLLSSSPTSVSTSTRIDLLMGKACVLQSSTRWGEAGFVWEEVLELSEGGGGGEGEKEEKVKERKIYVQGERAWCLFSSSSFSSAREGLEVVVKMCEERKVVRDGELKEREKIRSKAGLERCEGVEEGETAVESEQRGLNWWRLGQCLWEMSAQDSDLVPTAYEAFTSSIKACPTFAPPFTSLGLYYRSLSPPSAAQASKCFQKAFELSSTEEVAARYLAEEYAESDEWSLVEMIARRVVDGASTADRMGGKAAVRFSWAWKAIGGAELNAKKYPTAISAFQQALRGSPTDVHTWIKLGVAYRSSGMHIAALKVFAKALSIDPNSWYAKYSVGDVQREIGLLEPAIKAFRLILEDRPGEIGVRVVLAETALTLGLDQYRAGFLARAEESLVEALREATKITEEGSASRIAWKVVGDALVGLGKIPEPVAQESRNPLLLRLLSIMEELEVDQKLGSFDTVTLALLRELHELSDSPTYLKAFAVLAYKTRVLLETQNEAAIGSAWLDLGLSIESVRPYLLDLGLSTTSEEALHQAIRCLKFALHKEPVNSIFWNALGVLSFDLSPRLSQHSFIKSIEYNSRSAVPWTNLGLFYLVQGDEELANQSFLKAQVIDPDWAAAWIGQATLADLRGHVVDSSVLLEHAFSLGGDTPEADIAYATRTFDQFRRTPSAQTRPSATSALAAPLFALTRYLSKRPEDVSGLHLNALLLEQVGDLKTACESLEKAANLLEQLYEVDESPEVEGQYVIAQTNLGRVRLASLDYDGALNAFEAALSLIDINSLPSASEVGSSGSLSRAASILLWTECKLGSGLAQYWLGDRRAGIELLEAAAEDIENVGGSRRADVVIALGRIYWTEGDEDRALGSFGDAPDVVRQISPLFVKLSMYALAIVTADKAILENVARVNASPEVKFHPDITRLNVLSSLMHGNQVGALANVSRTLHSAPWAPDSRRSVASLLVQISPINHLPDSHVNLDICSRLIKTERIDGQNAEARSMRHKGAAMIHLVREHQEEVDQAVGLLGKAVFLSPWSRQFRDDLETVRNALKV